MLRSSNIKSITLYDLFFIFLISILSYYLQNHVYFNWDASWHLEGARRIAAGTASFSKNLIDDNSPMVYWFFIPAVLLHSMTNINIIDLCNTCVIAIVIASVLLSSPYLKIIYTQASHATFQLMRYLLLFTLLFLMSKEFAQRDMIVTTLMMPYIILSATQLATHRSCSTDYFSRGLIGIFAAIGVAMNPFYSISLLSIEIFLCLRLKKINFRFEKSLLLLTLGFYFSFTALLYPDYYRVIIPGYLAFSSALNVPKNQLLQNYFAFSTMLSTLLFILFITQKRQSDWMCILWICITSSFLIYVINGKLFTSHVVFILTCIVLFFSEVLYEALQIDKKNLIYLMMPLTALMLFYPIYLSWTEYRIMIHIKENAQNPMQSLINFFNQFPKKKSLLSLCPTEYPALPMTEYTHLNNLTPWADFWAGRTLILSDNAKHHLSPWKQRKIIEFKKITVDAISNIIQNQKPDFIITETPEKTGPLSAFNFLGEKIVNLIDYYNTNKTFKVAWQHYRLIQTISGYEIYARKK